MTQVVKRFREPVEGAYRSALSRYFDLCRQGRYHDAHDVLEPLWLALPLRSPPWYVLRKLIQIAVAFHHHAEGNPVGARRTLARAAAAKPVLEAVEHRRGPSWHTIDSEIRLWLRDFDRNAEVWEYPFRIDRLWAGNVRPGGTEV